MKKGSYVTDSSREFMERAQEEISKKMGDIGSSESVVHEARLEIERDVMRELMGPDKPGRARGHGAGVTKSQVTKFSFDLRKMRGDALTNHNRLLMDKVETQRRQIESQSKIIESQSKQIESQNKQIQNLEQKIDGFSGELQVFRTAFQVLLLFAMFPT